MNQSINQSITFPGQRYTQLHLVPVEMSRSSRIIIFFQFNIHGSVHRSMNQ